MILNFLGLMPKSISHRHTCVIFRLFKENESTLCELALSVNYNDYGVIVRGSIVWFVMGTSIVDGPKYQTSSPKTK